MSVHSDGMKLFHNLVISLSTKAEKYISGLIFSEVSHKYAKGIFLILRFKTAEYNYVFSTKKI
jgi:hypothetical protein